MQSNFLLGTLNISEAAQRKLGRTPLDLVARHAVNDHGKVTLRELKQNLNSMKTASAIKSRYAVDPTDPRKGSVVIITENEWGATHVTLEEEL